MVIRDHFGRPMKPSHPLYSKKTIHRFHGCRTVCRSAPQKRSTSERNAQHTNAYTHQLLISCQSTGQVPLTSPLRSISSSLSRSSEHADRSGHEDPMKKVNDQERNELVVEGRSTAQVSQETQTAQPVVNGQEVEVILDDDDDDVIFIKQVVQERMERTFIEPFKLPFKVSIKFRMNYPNHCRLLFHPELNVTTLTSLDVLKKTIIHECAFKNVDCFELKYMRDNELSCLTNDHLVRSMVNWIKLQFQKKKDFEPEIEMNVIVPSLPVLNTNQTSTHK